MIGFGWIHLQTTRNPLTKATLNDVDKIDSSIEDADHRMFSSFREWMASKDDPFLVWSLLEHHNNHHGMLTFCLSRNHRSSLVWEMLEWICANAEGSYGLFYCHDDEDTMSRVSHDRLPPMDYDNVFRVHRVRNGQLEELADPFFGTIDGGLRPVHPYDRCDSKEQE